MHPWRHYVALGDSFTEGVGDPVDGFAMLGAVDLLAAALRRANPDLRFTNLAQRGLGVSEIFEQQLEPALQLKPDLVSVVAGANDVLTGRFSAARWEEEFGRIDARTISARSEPADWSEDGVHLNARGYFKFAQEVLKILEQQTDTMIGEIGTP